MQLFEASKIRLIIEENNLVSFKGCSSYSYVRYDGILLKILKQLHSNLGLVPIVFW